MHREMDRIRKRILALGALVEDRVRMATRAIENQDADTARQIIQMDWEIDDLEVEIEEECLKILALHQPVAVDLRFLIAAIKINNDLERVGDLAVNIAYNVITMCKYASQNFVFDYATMSDQTEVMLRMSLDALVSMDVDLARLVVQMDDKVDNIMQAAYDRIKQAMGSAPEQAGFLLNLLMISRHLERLADHATNIAEEIIYLIDGIIVRHRECA
jgi:phosphate transport system protein